MNQLNLLQVLWLVTASQYVGETRVTTSESHSGQSYSKLSPQGLQAWQT
jgi:hypothetical protein